jgi:hypothetical protein
MPITISGSTGIAGVDGSASTPAVQGTDTNTGIFFPAADTIAFGEGGSEVMRIDSSGNVGIGTTAPDALLTVNTIASFGAGAAALPSIAAKGDLNTGMWFPAADTIAASTGGSERLRIDTSGNVGIGTSSPGSYGKLAVASSGNTGIGIQGNGQTVLSFFNAAGSLQYTLGRSLSSDNAQNFFLYDNAATATRLFIDSSGNLQFNSGYGSVATAYGCRAWVNFNGTGTVAIRSSGNVSSITDNGTGDYSINFTTAMPDLNYAYSHAYSNEVNVTHTVGFLSTISAAAIRVQHYNTGDSVNTTDKSYVFISVFR